MKIPQSLFTQISSGTDIPKELLSDPVDLGIELSQGLLAESKKMTAKFLREIPADQSVSEWSRIVCKQWSDKLGNLDNPDVAKLLTKYHLGVKNQGGSIVSFHATTKNGSDLAGKDGENIGCFEVVPLLRWASSIRRDGFTELKLVCYPNSDLPDRFELIRTNAFFTKQSLPKLANAILALLTGFPSSMESV